MHLDITFGLQVVESSSLVSREAFNHPYISFTTSQRGNSWGGCGPPNFWPTTFFSGFSHTTDRKVPSEVVLKGSFMSVIYGNVR